MTEVTEVVIETKCPRCFGQLRKTMQFEAQLNRSIPIVSCITSGNEVHVADVYEMAKSLLIMMRCSFVLLIGMIVMIHVMVRL